MKKLGFNIVAGLLIFNLFISSEGCNTEGFDNSLCTESTSFDLDQQNWLSNQINQQLNLPAFERTEFVVQAFAVKSINGNLYYFTTKMLRGNASNIHIHLYDCSGDIISNTVMNQEHQEIDIIMQSLSTGIDLDFETGDQIYESNLTPRTYFQ